MTWQIKKDDKDERTTMNTWWSIKRSEYEWTIVIDDFFVGFVPKWFSFIGFLLALGALKYVEQRSNSIAVDIVYVVTFFFLIFYLQALFYRFPFFKLLPVKFILYKSTKFYFSIVLAVASFYLTNLVINQVVNQLALK